MVTYKLKNKPSFKVRHPYGNLITSIFAGVIFMLASVLSLSTSFFGLSDSFKTYAFTGNGTSQNPYVIYTKDDFTSSTIQTALASSSSYVVLGADIHLGANQATNSELRANFDGKHYTITSSVPFVNTNRGTIKNTKFAFASSTFNFSSKVVASANYGTLDNLRILNTFEKVTLNVTTFGGFANSNYGTISQSINAQNLVNNLANSTGTAGIVAKNYATVNTSVNRGNITVTGLKTLTDKEIFGVAAGIVAVNEQNASYTNLISDSYNEGTIQAANGGTDTIGNGVRGAHAGGIVGINNVSSGIRTTVNRTINYGKVFAGNGGHGQNGTGGNGGKQTLGGIGGTAGFGGGAGGNAGGIVGYAVNTNYIIVSNSFNFGTLLSGKGGNGGIGGGGGGGSFGLGNKPSSEISISVQGTSGNANGAGGKGAIASSYYAGGQAITFGAGGGGGGGGAGDGGNINDQFTTALSADGGKGSSGSNGTATIAGLAGTAGTHRGMSTQPSQNGIAGERTYSIEGHFGYYTVYAGNGGNGGLGGLGGSSKSSYTKTPSINKTTYTTFDFVSNNGWNMTDTKPILRFEQGDTYVNVAFAVFYKGVNVTQTSSNYVTLNHASNLGTFQYTNGAWASYTNPVIGGSTSMNASVNSYFNIANAGNYIYSVSGVEEVVALSKPTSYGATISNQFNMSDDKFRSNDDNIIEVTIHVYDQLQGNGTQASPYMVQNFYDFANMDVYDSPTAVFKLNNNITEVTGYNNSYILTNFNGTLLGNGKTITRNGNYNRSLFMANNGTITNLNIMVSVSNISFNENVFGLLVSDNQSGTITNVKVVSSQTSVTFTGAGEVNFAFGAIAGWNSGTMEQVSNHMNFSVSFTTNQSYTNLRHVGGLVGLNKISAKLTNSKSVANITFVAPNAPTSNVTVYLGGIAGASEAQISNVYSIGNLVATTTANITDYANGIANSTFGVTNAYYNGTISNASYSNLIASSATNSYSNITSSKPMSEFVGWNFNSVWVYNSYVNNGLPALRHETGEEMSYSVSGLDFTKNTITVTTPLQFASLLKNLATFAPDMNVRKTIFIGANLDMRGYSLPQVNIPSQITLDGNNFTISNITSKNFILNTNFGFVNNLKIANTLVSHSGNQYVGGLFVQNDGTISNVEVGTTVMVTSASNVTAGGLVALNNGTITSAIVNGQMEITNSTNVTLGGVAGVAKNNISYTIEANQLIMNGSTFASIGRLVAEATNNLSSVQNISYGTVSGYAAALKMFGSSAGFNAVNNYLLNNNTQSQTGVTLLTSAQFKNSNSFANFNFAKTWYQEPNQNPTLWFTVPNTHEVSIGLGLNTVAYTTLYTSAGETLNTITTSAIVMVKNGTTIATNLLPTNLREQTNTIVFATTDGEAYYVSVSLNETNLVSETSKVWNHGVTITNSTTSILNYMVSAHEVAYAITLAKPLANGSENNLGAFELSIVRNAQTITPSIAYNENNLFTYANLRKDDQVTLTYTDSTGNSLKTVNELFNYYLANFTQNGNTLQTTRTATSVTATFVVNPQTASATGSVQYGATFTKLKHVQLVSNVNGLTTTEPFAVFETGKQNATFTSVFVLGGTNITVSVPQTVQSSENEHSYNFSSFTFSNHTVSYTGTSATFVVNNDVVISANYAANFYDVTIELTEEFNTGNTLKHNAIMVNGSPLIQTAVTTHTVAANATITITVLTGTPNTIFPALNTNGYWAWYYNRSILPMNAELRGLYTDAYSVLEPLYNTYTSYNNYYTSEITFTVNQNYLGDSRIKLSFEQVKVTPYSALMGQGTQESPYIISDAKSLFTLSQSFETGANPELRGGKYFKLAQDIDLKVYTYAYGYVKTYFKPIGTSALPFDGHFDGGTYSIQNLLVENDNANYAGLFGVTTASATLHHVYLENATIINNQLGAYVGGLVGLNNGTITNSAVSRGLAANTNSAVSSYHATTSTMSYVGGLVGRNNGTIQNSYNLATVTSDNFAGGLVGWSVNGKVVGSYNAGAVNALYASGLVGKSGDGTSSQENTITYSYNSGAVTAFTGGLALGITYNFATNAGNAVVTLKETYALNNVSQAFANNGGNGISGNLLHGLVSAETLQDRTQIPSFVNTKMDGVGYLFATVDGENEKYDRHRQFNQPFPMIAGFWQEARMEIEVYYNNEKITSLEQFDVNGDGISELISDYPLNRPFVTTLYTNVNYLVTIHNSYLVHFTYGEKVKNGVTTELFNTIQPYYYAFTEYENAVYKLYLESYYLEVEYLGTMQTENSVTSRVISTFENNNYYAYSKFTNVTLNRVQLFNGTSYVNAAYGTQTYSIFGSVTLFEAQTGMNKGVRVNLYAQYTNVKIRILPEVIVNLSVNNLDAGSIQFVKVNGSEQTVVETIGETGTHLFTLPLGEFASDQPVWFTYQLNFNRVESSNTVLSLNYYNTNVFTNVYGETGYQPTGYNQTIHFLGNVPTTSNAFLNTTNNAVEILVNYVEVYKQLTVNLNTTYTATAPQISVTTTDVIDGNSTKELTTSAVFNMHANRIPTLSLTGVGAVSGYNNVFVVNGKAYRAIWFYGNSSNFLTELAKAVPTNPFGTQNAYTLPVSLTTHTEVTIYLVELFSVGATSAMHSTSFGSSFSTDDDHRPSAVLTSLTAKTYGGKTLPGVLANVANSTYVDIHTNATYTTSKAHLTESIDQNRYAFVNWNNIAANNNETSFVVENITQNTNAVAYYKIKTVSLHIGTNLSNNLSYDAGISILGHGALTQGSLNYDYSIYNPNEIDTTTYRYQWVSGDKVMMEKYINGANYTIQPEQSVAPYGLSAEKFLVGYGETILLNSGDISYSQVTDIWYINLLNFEYYQDDFGSWFSRLVPYYTQNFTPLAVAPQTEEGIYTLANGYKGGVNGQIFGDLVIQMMFYSKYTVSLNAEVATTSSASEGQVSTNFTADRAELSATLPNGETVNVSNFMVPNNALLNDQSEITIRYNISENANGYDLSKYEFVGWRTAKHIYKDMYTQLSNDIITQNKTVNGVTYVMGEEVEMVNGKQVVYKTLTFKLNNTAREMMIVNHNVFPMFVEHTKVVTLNQNLANAGSFSVTNSSGNEVLGLNGLNANQFHANAFETYTVYVLPNDSEGYTLSGTWLTILNSDFTYDASFNASGNYGTITLNVIFDNLASENPELLVTFTNY